MIDNSSEDTDLYATAHRLFKSQLYPSAHFLLSLLLSTSPSPESHLLMADTLVALKEPHRSIPFYEQYLSTHSSAAVKCRFAGACIEAKMYYKAKAALESIATDKRSVGVLGMMGGLYLEFGETKAAVECYRNIYRYL